MDKLFVVTAIAIVFGPRFVPVISPAAARWPSIYFVFGSLQVVFGIALYVALAFDGYVLPWALFVSLYGIYYLWRGWALRKGTGNIPQSGGRSGGGMFP
jgi:hypothetical protein